MKYALNTLMKNSTVKLRKYFINKVGQYMDIDEMFDAFWKAYPRRLDKIKARKAFKKLNPSEKLFNTILSTLEKQKNNYNWKKENRQYMPYPATYLNNRRWEDEDGTDNESNTSNQAFGTYL